MADFKRNNWHHISGLESCAYTCWNCGKYVASDRGFVSDYISRIYICPHCQAPYMHDKLNHWYPASIPGRSIARVPDDIKNIFDEARVCFGAGAYTATVMLLRKILMNIAVAEGAETNMKFFQYVEYLCTERIVHKKQQKQAEEIKELGNAANHEIESRTKSDAEKMLKLIELILINNYEQADEVIQTEPEVVI